MSVAISENVSVPPQEVPVAAAANAQVTAVHPLFMGWAAWPTSTWPASWQPAAMLDSPYWKAWQSMALLPWSMAWSALQVARAMSTSTTMPPAPAMGGGARMPPASK